MGVAVAAKETFEAKDVTALRPADNDRPSRARFEKAHAAQDQRAHDPLAKLGLGDQERTQAIRRDDQRFDCFHRIGIDQCRPPRQLRELAHE
ncbi:MAG: hypothetical protein QOF14_5665 [Hyphomicrobiales bacterium]|jgi:hypothetical protein|nr:hypothetical protein [Hyphomicrobiales bacterium]